MRKLLFAVMLASGLATSAQAQVAASNITPLTEPIIMADGKELALGTEFIPELGVYFAGCIVNDPNAMLRGFQLYSNYAHWFPDGAGSDQTFKAAVNAAGGFARFIMGFKSQLETCFMDLSGFSHQNSLDNPTMDLLPGAMDFWHLVPTQWPGLAVAVPVRP